MNIVSLCALTELQVLLVVHLYKETSN